MRFPDTDTWTAVRAVVSTYSRAAIAVLAAWYLSTQAFQWSGVKPDMTGDQTQQLRVFAAEKVEDSNALIQRGYKEGGNQGINKSSGGTTGLPCAFTPGTWAPKAQR